jgi:hypothetical protein
MPGTGRAQAEGRPVLVKPGGLRPSGPEAID